MPPKRPQRRETARRHPRKPNGFSWCLVDTLTRMSGPLEGVLAPAVAQRGATERHASGKLFPESLLRAQPMQLFGNLGGTRVDGQQPFQFLHRQVGLSGLGVDLRQMLGGGPMALVELQRPP